MHNPSVIASVAKQSSKKLSKTGLLRYARNDGFCTSTSIWLSRLSLASLLLAFGVILLGAYTRLVDAGLGCPDWPGCYGQLIAPTTLQEISAANAAFPASPVNVSKAWTEMTHRYFAQLLGSLILLFAGLAYWKRQSLTLPVWLPGLLVVLVISQGILGMWTVTLRLLPLVVVSHLLGGFTLLALLWLCWLFLRSPQPHKAPRFLTFLAPGLLIILLLQILLGGLTSANYAALICPDFPTCQNQWWPTMTGKTAIHMLHRIGAIFTLVFGLLLAFRYYPVKAPLSLCLALLLLLQVSLGISNIVFYLPLPIAVAHNGVAALLLLTLVTINFKLFRARGLHV